MTVFRNQNQWEISNVEFSDGRIAAYDKRMPAAEMHYVDYGLSAFEASVFSGTQEADLTDIFQSLVNRQQLAGFEVKQRFYEVGSWEGIRALQTYLSSQTA
jgi:N-acetyl-alpha-D-muramate 1-phosphate uridylyltransferase